MTAGVAFAAYKINSARGSRSARSNEEEEEKKEEEWLGFEDPEYNTNKYISRVEAEIRS